MAKQKTKPEEPVEAVEWTDLGTEGLFSAAGRRVSYNPYSTRYTTRKSYEVKLKGPAGTMLFTYDHFKAEPPTTTDVVAFLADEVVPLALKPRDKWPVIDGRSNTDFIHQYYLRLCERFREVVGNEMWDVLTG